MKIELSEPEIKLIDKALQAWESEASSSAMMGSMFSIMLAPKEHQDEEKVRTKAAMDGAAKEGQDRRIRATLLRAKLFQSLNRESEFTTSEAVPV